MTIHIRSRLGTFLLWPVMCALLLLSGCAGAAVSAPLDAVSAQPVALSVSADPQQRTDPIKAVRAEKRQKFRKGFAEDALENVKSEQQLLAETEAVEFVTLRDETETLALDVPRTWGDIDFGPWVVDGETVGAFITASTDLGAFERGLDAPGVFFAASPALLDHTTERQLLQLEEKRAKSIDKNCKAKTTVDFQSAFTKGQYLPFDKCKDRSEHLYIVAVMAPASAEYVAILRINAPDGESYAIAQKILESFQVVGAPGHDEHHDH